uniref:Uncharacterized protein n=1 Tax=Arundo donax TaxID=35708 RepID=A0A0A9HJ65_ARUDO
MPPADRFVQGAHAVFDEMCNKDGMSVHFVHELKCCSVDRAIIVVREGIGDAHPMLDNIAP